MKRLKKLSLNKELVVNLNDSDMNRLKGGSSWYCGTVATLISIVQSYGMGQEQSWWVCGGSGPNCMSNISEKKVWDTSVAYCEIPEVVVYGYQH
jgi:natural product precursor